MLRLHLSMANNFYAELSKINKINLQYMMPRISFFSSSFIAQGESETAYSVIVMSAQS